MGTNYAQMNDCTDPIVNGCSSSDFVFSSVGDDYDDFPVGSAAAGCLWSGDNQFVYLVLTANMNGPLEWSVHGSGNTGYMDWAIWPFTPTTCTNLLNGTLAPLACCWNAASAGFAGMAAPGNLPPGANAGNFQPPINLVAGQQYLLGISNYSGTLDGQSITLTFNNPNLISCVPTTPDQTICLGNSANVTIQTPGMTNPTYTWLVTNGVSNTSSGTNVTVTPTVTTNYQVEVQQAAAGSQIAIDTIIDFTITVILPPVPNAGIDQSVCKGQSINLTGTGSNPADVYTWSAITTGVVPTPVVTFAPNTSSLTTTSNVNQAGVYKFVLEENNSVCPAKYDTCTVTVIEVTQTITQVSPSCFGTADGEIHITSALGTQFSFDNGATWQASPIGTGFVAGTYTVCSKNALGCQVCGSITVVDPAQVVVSVSNDTLICQNGTATLTASATGGTTYLYHWDNTANTGATQTVNPTVATAYTVFAENQNGCVSTPKTIHVTIRPPISGTISPNQRICPGYSAIIQATATGGDDGPYTFTWSTSQTGVGLSNQITVSPNQDRNYIVTITDGCESSALVLTDTVFVSPAIVPQFTVDDNELCEPATFVLHNTTDPTMVDHVTWNFSNGDAYTSTPNLTTAALKAGHYSVQLIVTSPDGCVDSLTQADFLISDPKPKAVFQFPSPIKMFNTMVQFTNTSTSAVSYVWSFEEGSPTTSTLTAPKVKFPDGVPGEYEVMLVAESDKGCLDTTIQKLIIVEEVLLYVPNAFTPDGDNFNQTWGIFIEGIDVNDFELLDFDRWGELVWESHDIHATWDGTYASKEVPDGMYTWTIRTKDLINDAKYYFNGHIQLLR